MHFNQINLIGLMVAFCSYELEWLAARHGVRKSELEILRRLVKGPFMLPAGGVLYRQGTEGRAIYAIGRGSFKTCVIDEDDGEERVTGLHFEGDLIGHEALAGDRLQATATALEASQVFRLGVEDLERAMRDVSGLQREVLRLMSRELWKQEERMRLLGERDPMARLAAFLLYLSGREGEQGRDPSKIRLSMRRQDLAGFLGLATETVSRLLRRCANSQILGVKSKRITLYKMQEVARLARRRYLHVVFAVSASPLLLGTAVLY